MPRTFRPALSLLALFTVLFGLAYPALVTGLGQWLVAAKANGSIINVEGRPVGSALIGQAFSDPGFFWGRASATPPGPYNAGASTGSNLGPSNPALLAAAKARVAALRAADPGNLMPVPVDLVTASASGLDPHISRQAALIQVGRVARARSLQEAVVRRLVGKHVEGTPGLFGEPRVNVLRLNLALERLAKTEAR